jgi:hypothetical protein
MKRFNPLVLVLLGVLLMMAVFTGCKTDGEATLTNEEATLTNEEDTDMAAGKIMDIVVRQVKDGQMDEFVATRTAFVEILNAQPGVVAYAEFKSVSSFGPDFAPVAVDDVYVGMVVYESAEASQKADEVLMGLPEAGAFFETFDMLALQRVEPQDGNPIELNKIAAEPGQCIELPIRNIFDQEGFEKYLPTVASILSDSKGFIGYRELESTSDGTTVGMLSWESLDSISAADPVFFSNPDALKFFGTFEMLNYQRLVRISI